MNEVWLRFATMMMATIEGIVGHITHSDDPMPLTHPVVAQLDALKEIHAELLSNGGSKKAESAKSAS